MPTINIVFRWRTALERLSALILLLAAAAPASATLLVTAPNIAVPYSAAPQSGTFEVYLQDTGAPGPQVGAALVELKSQAGSPLTFAALANSPTVDHPYLFTGSAPTTATADGGHTFLATDYADSSPPLAFDGAGLALVSYTLTAGATGTIPMTFIAYPQGHIGTGLFDPESNQIAASLVNGSITIEGSPVPEPTTLALALSALVGVNMITKRHKQAEPSRTPSPPVPCP